MDKFNIVLSTDDILEIASWLDAKVGDVENVLRKIYMQAKNQKLSCSHTIFISGKCIKCGSMLEGYKPSAIIGNSWGDYTEAAGLNRKDNEFKGPVAF